MPPFPDLVSLEWGKEHTAKDAEAAAAYNACILELISVKAQDKARRDGQ